MSLAVSFSNIVEMFHNLAVKMSAEHRPYLMRKVNGTYEPMTHAEVRDAACRFAHGLHALGIRQGENIAILSENRPEWIVADLGILAHRCVDVPIFPSQTAKQIEYILQNCMATTVIVSNQFQLTKVLKIEKEVRSLRHIIVMNDPGEATHPKLRSYASVLALGAAEHERDPGFFRRAADAISPGDLCTIIYTSGTTGDPKGVMLTHGNFVSNITSAAQILPIGMSDTALSFLPLCHVFERMAGYYTVTACGASIAFAESIDTVAENLLEIRPTIVCSVPRLFERMSGRIIRTVEKGPAYRKKIFSWAIDVGHDYATARRHRSIAPVLRAKHAIAERLVFRKLKERTGGRIRFFVSGGAALARELGEFFEAIGLIIIEGYGLTESSPVISANSLDAYHFGSVGHPIPGVEVRIADDGEILTRGPHVMKGYFNDRKATDDVLDRDGWLHTGDIGVRDEHGFLFITDRKKHLFVSSGGKNIAPQPIENLFAGSDLIDQFVLIGDRRMFLTALIVPNFDALKEYADARGIAYANRSDLVNNAEIYALVEERIQHAQRDLANFERVRRFTLLDTPMTIENGELTPTLKVKRKAVEERYRDLIEAMYRT